MVLVHRAGSDNRFRIGLEITDHDPSLEVATFDLHIFFHRQCVTFCSFIKSHYGARSLVSFLGIFSFDEFTSIVHHTFAKTIYANIISTFFFIPHPEKSISTYKILFNSISSIIKYNVKFIILFRKNAC